jgi:hypothetical protein
MSLRPKVKRQMGNESRHICRMIMGVNLKDGSISPLCP